MSRNFAPTVSTWCAWPMRRIALSVGAPANGTPNGRAVTVADFSDGTVTSTGSVTHFAIVDTVNSRLLAAGPLSASQSVTSGNTFAMTGGNAAVVRIPDAA